MKLIEKMRNGVNLTEDEIKSIVCENSEEFADYKYITCVEGKASRWTRSMAEIFEIDGEYWAVPWQNGLTEYQEDTYIGQPYRVEPIEETIIKWIKR